MREPTYAPSIYFHGRHKNGVLYVGFPLKKPKLLRVFRRYLEQFCDAFPESVFRVILFPTHFKKMMPVRTPAPTPITTPITAIHINSAMITSFPSNPDMNNVIIYREEECPKVLVHELCHYLNLDIPYGRGNDAVLMKRFHLKTDCFLSETFCEVVGLLYNVYETSMCHPPSKHRTSFRMLYTIEHTYTIFKTSQILDHYAIHTPNELYKLVSDTNTLTYTVFKGAYLESLLEEHKDDLYDFTRDLIANRFVIGDVAHGALRALKAFRAHIVKGMRRLFAKYAILRRDVPLSMVTTHLPEEHPPLENSLRLTVVEE